MNNNTIPAAPPGYMIPTRTHGGQQYIVTGWYPSDSPDNKEGSCYRAPALVLDMDLIDFWIHHHQITIPAGAAGKRERKLLKNNLYNEDKLVLQKVWQELCKTASSLSIRICDQLPTITVNSGWGLHLYYWLPNTAGYKDTNDFNFYAVRTLNRELVTAINLTAGFELADPAVHDAGTRLLRPIGSTNTNAGYGRPVVVVSRLSSNHICDPAVIKEKIIEPFSELTNYIKSKPQKTTSSFAQKTIDFSSMEIETSRGMRNLQLLADDLARNEKRRIVCPFAGSSVGSAFVTGGERHEQRLVSNAASCVYTNSHQSVPLVRGAKGQILKSYQNLINILEKDQRLNGFWMDTFRTCRMWKEERIEDKHYRKIKRLCLQYYTSFPVSIIKEVCKTLCEENERNPLQEELLKIYRDTPRIAGGESILDEWLVQSTGCPDTTLFRAYGRCFLIAAIARAFSPGCKCDNVLILQGKQGIKKSTLFATLAGEKYFCDTFINIGNKDAYLQLSKAWLYELAELDSFYRKDASQIKAFLSSAEDLYRPPYSEEIVSVKRKNLIVGSTNEGTPLKDDTGNRRFWLVPCGEDKINLKWLRANRSALWAWAYHCWKRGDDWWLSNELEDKQAEFNSAFVPQDAAHHYLYYWLQERMKGSPRGFEFRLGDAASAFVDEEAKQMCRPPSAKMLSGMLLAIEGMSKRRSSGVIVYKFAPPAGFTGWNVPKPERLKISSIITLRRSYG